MKNEYSNKSMRTWSNHKYGVTVEANDAREAQKKIKKKVKEMNKKRMEAKKAKSETTE